MLTCLRVRDLAIIDALEVEFGPGLSVLTGETGAGKSILVDALDLVLGGRASRDVVRTGAERADVEALFEDGETQRVLRRSVLANGRTRAYVDGDLATVAELASLARGLVDISSQHEHHTLVDATTHLEFLDAYAGLGPARAAMAEAHAAAVTAAGAVDGERERARGRVEREDLLRYQVGELERLALKPGEADALAEERERLRHAETLVSTTRRAEVLLHGKEAALCHQLGRLIADLEQVTRFDARLQPVNDVLTSALTDLEEAARDLGAYARGIDADPARLEVVEDRLHLAQRMIRKDGGTEDALLGHAERARVELEELDAGEERLEALERARDAAVRAASAAAAVLTDGRRRAAARLGEAITGELQSLGMGGARVEVDVAPVVGEGRLAVDGARLSATGIDRVEFLIAPNPGEEPRPLGRVASGGELSRALLAIKRVLAEGGPVGLYVFDEVDTGVGGAVAEAIGQKLAQVARHHQVICVTHLAQIAVYADAHFKVRKRVEDGRTRSDVHRLTEDERLEELSRMLGGIEVGDAHRAAAAAMLGYARSEARG